MSADVTTFSANMATTGEQRWGPRRLWDGRHCFQLWAPAEESVSLVLNGAEFQMVRSENGWHQVETTAAYGSIYGFVLTNGNLVSDPASRRQVLKLDGPSVLTSPDDYLWQNPDWIGRSWEETVVYEIHVGTFTEEGTFQAAIGKLQRLTHLGITALEIMPLAHFPGTRGWGYDGVLQFAPHNAYGTPDDFKAFVDAAHGLGLIVFLDVVYNHFGPEGNYLGQYAPGFFRRGANTPWGAAIAYEKDEVRAYFIENVLYWLRDFRLDGLRFDAIDQIEDGSDLHILEQIARSVREEISGRHVHLMTENPANGTDLMADQPGGRFYKADWNDDFHHSMQVAVTAERGGYFEPFKDDTWNKLRHVLAYGYFTPGKPTISDNPPPTEALPPTAFIHFLQNHDQVGNRALGDRLHFGIDRHLYRALTELLLLSPQIPLLFMGDDHLSLRPFHFFADYTGDVARAIRENRPKEAANFGGIPEGASEADIPDPNEYATFVRSKIDWDEADTEDGLTWSEHIRSLIGLRREKIVPLLANATGYAGTVVDAPDKCLFVDWKFGTQTLQLRANLSEKDVTLANALGDRIFPLDLAKDCRLGASSVHVFIR